MHCDFCHLPMPTPRPSEGTVGPIYCCYGCRFAAEVTRSRGEAGQVNWMLARLGIAVFLSMAVMMLAMYQYRQQLATEAGPSELARELGGLFQYAALLFATPVFVLLGVPIFQAAIQQARGGVLSTDALVVVGVGAAFVYSYIATLSGHGESYYETACVVLVFMTLGRWLEARGKLSAAEAVLSLERLLPDRVRIERDGRPLEVGPAEIVTGDLLQLSAGDRVPADGVIVQGCASVDEQLVTGESTPVVRDTGETVRAGTLDVDGALTVRATATGSASTLGRLIELLEKARNSRSDYQRLTERMATWFIPLTVLLALVGAVIGFRRGGASDAIMTTLSVLLIACPCALGIATPTAIWVALGRAARRQILIRDGQTIEILARVRTIYFDKTGTLTTGTPRVAEFISAESGGQMDRAVLSHTASTAGGSGHALARSLVRYISDRGVDAEAAHEVRSIAGRGLIARMNGSEIALGSAALMQERAMALNVSLTNALRRTLAEARPVACIGWEGQVRGVFSFDESLRENAEAVLQELKAAGVHTAVLTGDHAARGAALAGQLGTKVTAELLPQDKVRHIKASRRSQGAVAMVGDGLNDAPALSAADVGIAMGCGADLTRESARVCLAGNDLASIPWLLRLARRTVWTIKVNLFWAFAYNIVGIALALMGRLSPIFAAAVMVVSSLFVVGNSLRLGRVAIDRRS